MMLQTGAIMIARRMLFLLLAGSLLTVAAVAQKASSSPGQTAAKAPTASDISGTYTFLRDGEFVQLTLEDGQLSGYVSRFGDREDDKGEFIDQFFDKTSLTGDQLTFTTKVVHGVSYEFTGVIATTPGKQPSQEAYHVMKGNLVEHATDAKGAEKTMQRKVEFKSFPADLSKP
jgi:hypothetical protein